MGLDEIRKLKEQAMLPKEKKKYVLPKKSAKKLKQEAKEKAVRSKGGGSELDIWFKERRLEMRGYCSNCGKPSCKSDDKYYKFSIAHILQKSYVKSVATHESNFLELCFWGENSCHSQLDNGLLDLTEMNCWDEIVTKFQKMYPSIAPAERRRIPDILLQYAKNETDI